MALGDAQPLAELFYAVQPGVVFPDIGDGLRDQRRQGGCGAVGTGKLAEQGESQLAPHAAVIVRTGFCGQLPHQLSRGGAGLAPSRKGQRGQPGEEQLRRLPGQLEAEQMALALGSQSQRCPAEDETPGRNALGRQDQRAAGR